MVIPAMPNPEEPTIEEWAGKLREIVGAPDEETHLIGHSIGCQTILRYLVSLAPGQKIGQAVLVAGWFDLDNLETEEEKQIAKPWIETPMDFSSVKSHLQSITAILSDNDPFGYFESNRDIFEKQLGATVVVEPEKGHLSGGDAVMELPSVLEALNL